MNTALMTMLLGVLAVNTSNASASSQTAVPMKHETVVLLHGLYGMPLAMKRLERTFERQGYRVVNLAYPTWRVPLEEAVETRIHHGLQTRIPAGAERVHFVTHSMGGIALRLFLAQHAITNLGRVVMLAPPNQGSELAHPFKRCTFARWVMGPNLARLGTAPDDLPQRAGPLTCEFGVIAGSGSLLSKWFDPARPGDGRVKVEATKLPGMADHLVLPIRHSLMVCHLEVCEQAATFISQGSFTHKRTR